MEFGFNVCFKGGFRLRHAFLIPERPVIVNVFPGWEPVACIAVAVYFP